MRRPVHFPKAASALAVSLALSLSAGAVAGEKTWTGAVSTSWGVADNWDPVGVPAATDDLIIAGGTVALGGTRTVEGSVLWSGGRIQQGTLEIVNGAAFRITGEADKALDRVVLNNTGLLEWGGAGSLSAEMNSSSAVVAINNLAGGELVLLSDAGLERTGSYASTSSAKVNVVNAGMMRKSGGTGTSSMGVRIDFTNEGILDVGRGILEIQGPFGSGPESVIRTGVAGAEPGTGYGKLLLAGSASLDGRFEPYAVAGLLPDTVQEVVSLEGASLGGSFNQVGLVPMGHGYIGQPVLVGNRVTTLVTYGVKLHLLTPVDGRFAVQIAGEPNTDYVLEASEGLVNWNEVTTLNSPTGLSDWVDDLIADHPQRFYRVLEAAD
ncbi:MAG: hypothetical protein KDM81_08420 [Verrucomicrobiae bacterium]|nr:hypothetical protein [Verrucomicrobiae bacterium]